MEGAHDLGGLDGFGPVVTADGELTHHESWELRAQCLTGFGVGAGRSWIEAIDPATYLSTPYYGRWLIAGEHAGVAKGAFTLDDLARWRAVFEADPSAYPPTVASADKRAVVDRVMTTTASMAPADSPRFAVGERVVVQRRRDAVHHHRCPRYVRGAAGRVEKICGQAEMPEGDRRVPLYTIEFASVDLWGPASEPPFAVLVDLFEPYLESTGAH